MSHIVRWHSCDKCNVGPHQPEESATVRTLNDAVRAVPYGVTGYVNWSNPRRRWLIDRMGTLQDERTRI